MKSQKETKLLNWKPYESLAGLIMEAARELLKYQNNLLIENKLDHLSHSMIHVLSGLEPGMRTLSELSLILRQKPPSLLEMLRRLEKTGLVGSLQSSLYKKKIYWELTQKGKSNLQKASFLIRKKGETIDHLFKSIGVKPTEMERFKTVLSLVLKKHFRESDEEKLTPIER